MTLPTSDQINAALRHVATAVASIVGTLAAVKIISGGDAASLQASLDHITHGAAEILAGVTTLVTVASGAWAAISASPLGQLLRGSKAVAADPAKMEQLKTMSVEQQAPLVKVTDKLPEVAGVGTTSTAAGQALAAAVPSNSVQPVGTSS